MKEKQAVQKSFEEMSTQYEEVIDEELNLFWGWSYQNFLAELVKHTQIQKNQRILDIATGTSVIPCKLMELGIPGIKITGLDFTEAMLRQGQHKIAAAGHSEDINLVCADAMAIPYADQSFDVVVSGLASHHMDIPLMLSEMKRVLKPAGLLSLIDVGTSPIWDKWLFRIFARVGAFFFFLIRENVTRAWAEFNTVYNLRTPEGWENELSQAGFTDIRITKLKSKYSWIPEPLSIQSKLEPEEI
jgi:demethylmenaquinone methyltransferase/2-methoxy-6-polyprenyl-1,4-benzoquinol methylase